MPERETLERAREDKAEGKAPSTQAGEFIREEIHHIREGQHGARSTKQAIAIGLSKARRAGVPLKPQKQGQAEKRSRRSVQRAYEAGQGKRKAREPKSTVSRRALSRHARTVARRRKKA